MGVSSGRPPRRTRIFRAEPMGDCAYHGNSGCDARERRPGGHLFREAELPLLESALKRGWVVAVTDGEGLGMRGPHTYGAGRPGGAAMLDIVRTAQALADSVEPSAPVLIWGYSEGGRCAAWAAELQPTYAPTSRSWAWRRMASPPTSTPLPSRSTADRSPGWAWPFSSDWRMPTTIRPCSGSSTEHGHAAAKAAAEKDVVGMLPLTHPEPMAHYTVRGTPGTSRSGGACCAPNATAAGLRVHRRSSTTSKATETVPTHLGEELVSDYRSRRHDRMGRDHGQRPPCGSVHRCGHRVDLARSAPARCAHRSRRLSAPSTLPRRN